ncbi:MULTISPECIES: hypothetical protein [Flavobacterium]|jgi:hypothetical protein|uniref:Uncharacterized protein n=1 Tax=Flavobacterium johnsoniae (strain ATCC 17061 / DSM 2064 / JCM 8514 / BCRC 14874 / CCUG 350202 / NBRC 14942 / NCIMB 11054 / UW101) TaxID=376686 RepID=A5FHJ0_FLAJ1|nr:MULTISPECIES: hypothetical protein [Flavobacterium]ABQ05338.1 hypothetical protein Fjoh_2311 [Flavobacterium johnsoniae UW101]WDF61038.1 hypothetical protein PQ462_06640 [Flavobacterium sp. KACC 22758]WQG82859.1 hypothetical protein SR927_06985 [Flavobacterium johnsoniae UW101]SHL59341.1 hypothetical protein SAMN05444146_4165 [Flavobacterium johnsoniae]
MEPIYTIDELNQRIKLLEDRQDTEWCAIKDHIDDLKENLKPINLIRNTVEEINETVGFKSHLAQSAISIAIGYVAKRFIVGKGDSMFKGILGSIVQLIVTNMVSKPSESSNDASEDEEESLQYEPSRE